MLSLKRGPSWRYSASLIFTQIRPVWVDDVGTRPKIQKVDGFGLRSQFCTFSAVADIVKTFSDSAKKLEALSATALTIFFFFGKFLALSGFAKFFSYF
jgi:hypothetical protein